MYNCLGYQFLLRTLQGCLYPTVQPGQVSDRKLAFLGLDSHSPGVVVHTSQNDGDLYVKADANARRCLASYLYADSADLREE
jgi:hypothetical protein